ncbi:MAG: DUF2892 domain-containing protein [Elusimicrobia bacterium]|nr:DUF2892 domain-containing protein [Elusimicrobiota bacterium]
MSLHHRIRAIAGVIVLASLALAHWVDARFLWLTAFVGANLLQSAFTRCCLMEDILRSTGLDGPSNSRRRENP